MKRWAFAFLIFASVMFITGSQNAFATTVIIDNFDVTQTVSATGGTSVSLLVDPSFIGGQRNVEVSSFGLRPVTFSSNPPSNLGLGVYDESLGTDGTVVLRYSGIGGTGLGGIDLTDSSTNDRIQIELIQLDLTGDFMITVQDTHLNSASSSQTLPTTNTPTNIDFLFSSFSGIDFTSIDLIQVEIDRVEIGREVDFVLASISASSSAGNGGGNGNGKDGQLIGGKMIPIESTTLVVAGLQTSSWMIPVLLSGIGIGLISLKRK